MDTIDEPSVVSKSQRTDNCMFSRTTQLHHSVTRLYNYAQAIKILHFVFN